MGSPRCASKSTKYAKAVAHSRGSPSSHGSRATQRFSIARAAHRLCSAWLGVRGQGRGRVRSRVRVRVRVRVWVRVGVAVGVRVGGSAAAPATARRPPAAARPTAHTPSAWSLRGEW